MTTFWPEVLSGGTKAKSAAESQPKTCQALTHEMKLDGGVIFLFVSALKTCETTWYAGASYVLLRACFSSSSLLKDGRDGSAEASLQERAEEYALRKVELGVHLLVLGELHDQVRVPSLTLSDRRVEADLSRKRRWKSCSATHSAVRDSSEVRIRETHDELDVDLVGLGEQEQAGDARVEDLVVVGLSSQPEVGEEHVDVVPTPGTR